MSIDQTPQSPRQTPGTTAGAGEAEPMVKADFAAARDTSALVAAAPSLVVKIDVLTQQHQALALQNDALAVQNEALAQQNAELKTTVDEILTVVSKGVPEPEQA